MKKLSADSQHTKLIAAASAFVWTIAIVTSAGAAQLQEARVTQVVNDVKLLLEQSAPRPAALSDLIRRGTAVRTGTQSRSELTYADLTITRLGANTIFSFKEGTREMNLVDGAILFQVPKGSGGATIRTVGVTATITGTTGIGEFHPATTSHPLVSKWLCLEGKIVLHLPNGQLVELGPGKMVTTDGKSFSQVMTFDITRLVTTSLFFTGFDRPLPSLDLIMLAAQNQLTSGLLATNPLDPTRLVDVLSQVTVAEQTEVSPPPPPISPTPSKFGTPAVITSPDPYLITSGTVIKTDPSITTNGVTDYGKIYRGQTDDGAFSLWAFGSTSAFDTALRIDDVFFGDPSHLPIAVFKFQSLSLTGDPTIDTSNNGVTKLGLIGVDGITSGPAGGTLTFTGLDLLLLATVNGSINLTSDVSFQDLHELVMYARGAGSDVTINSPISNIGILGLVAEDSIHLTNPGTMSVGKLDVITGGGDMTLQIGGSLLLNGRVRLDTIVLPGASVASGANLTLNVTGDYTNNSATESSRLAITNRDHIGTGGNIGVNIGGDLTAMNDFNLVIQNTNRQIDNGGNITLEVGGSINVAGALDATLNNTGGLIGNDTSITITSSGAVTAQGDANFQILNNDGGQIGGNANISVTTGGDITANSILGFVNNHNGGAITSGANISFNIGGALNTQGDATFVISNLNEGPGGGTIGSLASLDINAASISVGGFFQTFVGANAGGSITGDASNTVNLTGDLVVQGPILADIQDTGFNQINPINFIAGGHIGGNATVTLSAQNITTFSTASGIPGIDTMALEASIYSNGSGTIGGDAIVNVSASQDISAPGTVFFTVANGNYMGFGGGTIGGDAKLNISAVNFMAGILFAEIFNYGASIGGNANINFNLTGDLTAPGDAIFHIFNYGGGSIVGNAAINVNAANITANSLLAEIDNSSAGQIGGNALINFGVSGDVNIAGDASFQILNNAGTIGGDTEINVNAANITANSLLAQIDNSNGGSIGTGGNISVSTERDFISSGDASFAIHNTAGSINNGGNITLTVDGSVSTGGQLSLLVENYDGTANPAGHIGTGGNISVTTPGDLTADSISAVINNRNGGTIGSAASLILNIAGTLTTLQNGTDYFGFPSSLSLYISSRYDDTLGSTIGGNATLALSADSASIGGNLNALISDRGGTIDGNALLNFNVAHDVTVQGDAGWQILNDSGTNMNAASPIGGTIHGTANLLLSAANLTLTAGSLELDIFNKNGGVVGSGGTIDSDANITFTLSGNLTTAGSAIFHILNHVQTGGTTGGTIGGDATINVTTVNISAGVDSLGRSLDALIANQGGSIGGSAIVNVDVTDVITAQGPANFTIGNSSGGSIGSDATINVSAANITANSLLAEINNSNGGMIGGVANVAVDVTNDVTAPGGVTLQILNGNSGHIVTGADVLYSVGGTTSTANLTEYIDNSNGGAIDNGGNATLHTVGPVMLDGPLFLDIDNFNGGTITNGADVTAHFVGDVTDTVGQFHSFNFFVVNGGSDFFGDLGGGTIGTGGNIDVTFDGNATTTPTATTGSFAAEIANDGGDIGTGGNISMTIGGNATAGGSGFVLDTSNRGGHIGTGGNITGSIAGDLTSATQAFFGVLNNGGSIGSGTNVTVNLGGDITTQDYAAFQIFNYDDSGSGPGTIGGNATISLSAANVSAGGSFFADIENYSGGTILGNATVNIAIGSDLSAAGDLFARINNNSGSIGGDSKINFNAVSISIGGSDAFPFAIINSESGHIAGDAEVNLTAGSLTGNTIHASIDNHDGGMIGLSAAVNLNVATISTTGEFGAFLGSFGTQGGGQIGGNASINVLASSGITAGGDVSFDLGNNHGSGTPAGSIVGNATLDVIAGSISAGDFVHATIDNEGGTIGGNATIGLDVSGAIASQNHAFFTIISNEDNGTGSGPGTISGDAMINVNAGSISIGGNDLFHSTIFNQDGTITGNSAIAFNISGAITTPADAFFHILNNGGTVGLDAAINVSANNISAGGTLDPTIDNSASGTIGGSANLNFNLTGDLTSQGDANFQILNNDAGQIGGNGNISVTTGGDLTANSIFAFINNRNGGTIGSANMSFDIGGALSTTGDATFVISNRNDGSGGGTSGGNVSLTLSAASISGGGILVTDVSTNQGGHIMGSAHNTVDAAGLLSGGTLDFEIENAGFDTGGGFAPGGTIDSDAILSITASGISTTSDYFNAIIANDGGGHIGSNATVSVVASSMDVATDAYFNILNGQNGAGTPTGSIGGNAAINLSANNISTGGSLSAAIDNSSGLGTGFIGATIGGDATINITAANLTANSLLAQIDNTGGSIGGNTEGGAMINMNVSNSGTVTNDATVAIYGSDGAVGGAGININGGNYNVGGTFLSYIDGNGTIAFNNINAHADVLKAGVFGTNGVLRIGGGMLSADSTLKLYAPGSNGQLNFISNVTLGGNSAKILAANSVTIFNNIVVTIGGPNPADVYTNNPNYSKKWGGNGSTTGTFAGAGAHDPLPLASAPPFDTASPVKLTIGGNIPSATAVPPQSAPGRTPAPGGNISSRTRIPATLPSNVLTNGKIADVRRTSNVINVRSSDELLSLLDDAAPGPGGKITIPPSKSASNARNSNRTNVPGRVNSGSRVNVDRRAMDMRTASSSVIRHSPQ